MAGVFKRASDKARGKAGKWTAWYYDEAGKRRTVAGLTDKAKTLELAQHREAEARRVREGVVDPADRARRDQAARPIADQVGEYRAVLDARGGSHKHGLNVESDLTRLFADAGVTKLSEMTADRLQLALGRLRDRRSARTHNKAVAFVRAFARWLVESERLKQFPVGLASLTRASEKADRRYQRRAITKAELARLLEATESGPTIEAARGPRVGARQPVYLTGPERAALYRLAMGTGFRAEEVRTLTPERFDLDGDAPTITVLACHAKNGQAAVQPISRELAAGLRPYVAGKAPGRPFLTMPEKGARMLHRDLRAAGIEPRDAEGRVIDFHALRASYITHLVADGVNPKVVQALARHSTITLTLDTYCKVERADLRAAIERGG